MFIENGHNKFSVKVIYNYLFTFFSLDRKETKDQERSDGNSHLARRRRGLSYGPLFQGLDKDI